MNNKVNVEIIVPEIEKKYNVLLPINKKMGTIQNLLVKAINELSNGTFPISNECKIYNAKTLKTYDNNMLLYSTDIRNSTKLVLLSKGC